MRYTVQRFKSRIKSIKKDGSLLGQILVNDPVCFRTWVRIIPEIDSSFGKESRRELSKSILILQEYSELFARTWIDFLSKDFVAMTPLQQKRVWAHAYSYLGQPDFFHLLHGELEQLIEEYSDQELRSFLIEAMEIFSESVEKAVFFLRQESQRSIDSRKQLQTTTQLEDCQRTLLMYGRAHCGENFQLLVTGNKEAYCDGVNVVLPHRLPFNSEIGEKVYRLLMAKNAGFLEFSTMEFSLDEIEGSWVAPRDEELELERLFRSFKSGLLAKELFFSLENFRVEQALRQEYSGLQVLFDRYGKYVEEWQEQEVQSTSIQRELKSFENFLAGASDDWTLLSEEQLASCRALSNTEAGVLDSIQLLGTIFPIFYQVLVSQESKDAGEKFKPRNSSSVQTKKLSSRDRQTELRIEEILRERAKKGEQLSRQNAKEIDFRETSEFLDRNPGLSAPKENDEEDGEPITDFAMELSKNMTALEGEFTYPEWDCRIEDWKLNWSRVQEFILPSDLGAFQKEFWGEYHQEIQRVKRVFQALRLEQEQPRKRLWDGDQIDFDRLLDASIAIQSKQEPDLRIYQRTHRQSRDIGVAFLVDMSSSTNEIIGDEAKRILDVEKQALFLIAEALHSLGDPFAIYGFSGFGREQVAFYIAKEMGEAWNEDSQAKLGAMSWKMENRDGAAIRHCTAKMKSWRQKQKLLILLSDGQPLDCGTGEYQDELAQMDTWRALQEAKQQGVRPFCITVDPHGKDYLETMYGQGNYIAISSIQTLPQKLPAIYRQLTGLGN